MTRLIYDAGSTLAARTIGGFALSIATSLSFESIFAPRLPPYDSTRIIPEQIDISKYATIWINVTTLFRNLMGSINKDALLLVTEEELAQTLNQEMELINSLFLNEGNNLCKVIYYTMSYKHLYRRNGVKFRTEKTSNQKQYKASMLKTIDLLMRDGTYSIVQLDSEIKPDKRDKSLIFTHIPHDLLSHVHFNGLDLLESHTGLLKTKHKWNTKYFSVGDSDLSHLPFNRLLLFIFGDKIQIQPIDIRLRRLILECSITRGWTPLTTVDKILLELGLDIKEPFVLEFIKNL
jgi:hypothetical protein